MTRPPSVGSFRRAVTRRDGGRWHHRPYVVPAADQGIAIFGLNTTLRWTPAAVMALMLKHTPTPKSTGHGACAPAPDMAVDRTALWRAYTAVTKRVQRLGAFPGPTSLTPYPTPVSR